MTSTLTRQPPGRRVRDDPSRAAAKAEARRRMMARRRRALLMLLSAVAVVLVGVDVARGAPAPKARVGAAPVSAPSPSALASPSPAASATPRPQSDGEKSPPAVTRKPVTPAVVSVVDRGRGTFTIAPGGTSVVGAGTVLRYEVRVEDGIGQTPAAFAAFVDKTLDDPRSWTADGKWGFQRIAAGTPDFVVTLASPKTVDALCAPLQTNSYTSCRVGHTVVVNLARWLLAVPDFKGDLTTYRTYVVNHEVGHRLGNGHAACPGVGHLAPVMQQQTLGLKGCRPNPWPYVNGQLVTGPPVP